MLAAYPRLENLEQLARLDYLTQAERAQHAHLARLRRYYEGQQPIVLSERQKDFLKTSHRSNFALNYCRLVVDAPAERLLVRGVKAEDALLEKWLNRFWNLARLRGLAQQLHRYANNLHTKIRPAPILSHNPSSHDPCAIV